MNVEGTAAIVTGATGGIGRVIALALDERGGRLVITGRRAESLADLAAQVAAVGSTPLGSLRLNHRSL